MATFIPTTLPCLIERVESRLVRGNKNRQRQCLSEVVAFPRNGGALKLYLRSQLILDHVDDIAAHERLKLKHLLIKF